MLGLPTDKSQRDANLFGGVFLAVLAWVVPAHAMFLPPFEAESTKRTVAFALAVFAATIGTGFVKRHVWALRAFIAYMLLGTTWHVLVGLTDADARWLLFSPLMNLPIALGIYLCVRGAFKAASPTHGATESGSP